MRHSTILLLLLPACWNAALGGMQEDTAKVKPVYYEVNDFVDENETCLRCHAEPKYTIEDTVFGTVFTEYMCPDRNIDREEYYSGVHKAFACLDCHSYDYETFPHPLTARVEEPFACLDCHGYDEDFAHYRFEEIQEQYEESIHNIDEFTCWKCHDPHSYRVFMREADDLRRAILYNNNICLECHADYDRFMLLTDRQEINLLETHDWLPNQAAHFKAVRCIECHTEISDSVLVAHKILPGSEAVERCEECHSRDSRLMKSLYKFEVQQGRQAGFANGIIINDAYVIGANQNIILNRISLFIFGLTLLVILFHTVLRGIRLKNNRHG